MADAILLSCWGIKLLKLLTSLRPHSLKSLVYLICLIELRKCESTWLFLYLAEDWVVFVIHLLLHFLMNLNHRVFPIYSLEAHRLSFSLLPHWFLTLIVRYSLSSLYKIKLKNCKEPKKLKSFKELLYLILQKRLAGCDYDEWRDSRPSPWDQDSDETDWIEDHFHSIFSQFSSQVPYSLPWCKDLAVTLLAKETFSIGLFVNSQCHLLLDQSLSQEYAQVCFPFYLSPVFCHSKRHIKWRFAFLICSPLELQNHFLRGLFPYRKSCLIIY